MRGARSLQPRIDRLRFHGEHGEHALVDTPQRLAADEPLETFDAERELAQGEVFVNIVCELNVR